MIARDAEKHAKGKDVGERRVETKTLDPSMGQKTSVSTSYGLPFSGCSIVYSAGPQGDVKK